MKKIELKPCPFCGIQEVRVEKVYSFSRNPRYVVDCIACDVQGPICNNQEEAIMHWNKRADV